MLYSENLERENRFILSLKIAIPFILMFAFFFFFFNIKDEVAWEDIILFVILFLCNVYYTVYLIYLGFNKSLIDPVSKVFSRPEIIKILSKRLKNGNPVNFVLIKVENIVDINDRYGYKNGDEILRIFAEKLDDFMKKNKIYHLKIGMITNGNFIFYVDRKENTLRHLLNIFKYEILNQNIKNIEVKSNFAIVGSDFDNNISNIIDELFYEINQNDDEKINIVDELENSIFKMIDEENFHVRTQSIQSTSNDEKFLYLISKISTNINGIGEISKSRLLDVILKNKYELNYDVNFLKFICKNVYFKEIKNKVFIEIFASTLRNSIFRREILRLIDNNLIDPKKVVFEFYESKIYPEISRFAEIIEQFKSLGFSFALSQFGGENASFEYFKYLNIDYVIYDMEFNKFINDNKIRQIFENLNKTCKILDIKTIMRFVDKKPLFDDVTALGVDYAQGFYIDKPTDLRK
ncbi:EAL domain-containing protein [Campylobacter hominis]